MQFRWTVHFITVICEVSHHPHHCYKKIPSVNPEGGYGTVAPLGYTE